MSKLSTAVVVFFGVLFLVSAAAWYARPAGLLESLFGGSKTAHIFFFPQTQERDDITPPPFTFEDAPAQPSPSQASSTITNGTSSVPKDTGVSTNNSANDVVRPSVTDAPTQSEGSITDENEGSGFGGTLSASLTVSPTLVRSGSTARLTWSSQNATACSLTGTNGDHWSTLSSSGVQSSKITGQTNFTLHCVGGSETSPTSVTKTAHVLIAPSFSE